MTGLRLYPGGTIIVFPTPLSRVGERPGRGMVVSIHPRRGPRQRSWLGCPCRNGRDRGLEGCPRHSSSSAARLHRLAWATRTASPPTMHRDLALSAVLANEIGNSSRTWAANAWSSARECPSKYPDPALLKLGSWKPAKTSRKIRWRNAAGCWACRPREVEPRSFQNEKK